jgi:hypothetical protein
MCLGTSGRGISVTYGGVVASNLISTSGSDDAVTVGEAVTVRHNVISVGGTGDGIEANSGNTIIGNAVVAGRIRFTGSANSYVDNVIVSGVDITGSGVELGENFCCTELPADCDGSTICPWP